MADEEEIEIKGADDITPEEIDPEDLIDVEGDIDPKNCLKLKMISRLTQMFWWSIR